MGLSLKRIPVPFPSLDHSCYLREINDEASNVKDMLL